MIDQIVSVLNSKHMTVSRFEDPKPLCLDVKTTGIYDLNCMFVNIEVYEAVRHRKLIAMDTIPVIPKADITCKFAKVYTKTSSEHFYKNFVEIVVELRNNFEYECCGFYCRSIYIYDKELSEDIKIFHELPEERQIQIISRHKRMIDLVHNKTLLSESVYAAYVMKFEL